MTEKVEMIVVSNQIDLEQNYKVDSKDCKIVEEISLDNALSSYFKEYNCYPKICYRWAWIFYMPVPEIEDLPLFRKGE